MAWSFGWELPPGVVLLQSATSDRWDLGVLLTAVALKALIGTEVGNYRLESAAWFSCYCRHKIGASRNEHGLKHDLSPRVIINLRLAGIVLNLSSTL